MPFRCIAVVLPLFSLISCGATPLATTSAGEPAATQVPTCVSDIFMGAERTTPPDPTPPAFVEPARGAPGTRVTVRATGLAPRADHIVVALYGDNDCRIAGLGDQLLGRAIADTTGALELTVRWPRMFTPNLGRGSFGEVELPPGRYWPIVASCAPPEGECDYSNGSGIGSPFVSIR